MYRKDAWRLVHRKQCAVQPPKFVTMLIFCRGTFLYFSHVRKGNVRHVTAGKGEGDPSVQLYSGSMLFETIVGIFDRRSRDAQY